MTSQFGNSGLCSKKACPNGRAFCCIERSWDLSEYPSPTGEFPRPSNEAYGYLDVRPSNYVGRMNSKKDVSERIFLDRFRNAYPFFPDGKVTKGEPGTEPDFIIEHPGGRLGIEMARLFRDDGRDMSGLARQGPLQRVILERAEKQFLASSSTRYRVIVGFHERSGITPRAIGEISEFLAKCVKQALEFKRPHRDNPTLVGSSNLYPFNEVFALIQIYDFSESYDYSWSIQNAFSVEALNLGCLKERIQEKENKRLRGLYKGVSKLWLLLYMDFFNPMMDQQIPSEINIDDCAHGFDKIIIFKNVEDLCQVIYPKFFV